MLCTMNGTPDVWAVFLYRVRYAVCLTFKLIWKLHVVMKGATVGELYQLWNLHGHFFRQKLEHDSASENQCIEVVNLGYIPKLPCTKEACCGTPLFHVFLAKRFFLVGCIFIKHCNIRAYEHQSPWGSFCFLLNDTVQLDYYPCFCL